MFELPTIRQFSHFMEKEHHSFFSRFKHVHMISSLFSNTMLNNYYVKKKKSLDLFIVNISDNYLLFSI